MKRKRILIIIIIVVVIALIAAGFYAKKRMSKAMTGSKTTVESVVRTSLADSISATGAFVSENTSDVSALLSGVEVREVKVEVGDTVEEGDVLCTFDVDDAKKSLSDAKSDLSKQQQAANSQVKNAQNAYELAKETKDFQIDSAKQDKKAASDAYESAKDAYEKAKERRDDLKTVKEEKKAALDAMDPMDPGFAQAATAYEQAASAYETAKASVSELKNAKTQAKNTMEKAESAYEYIKKQQKNSVKSAKESVNAAKAGMSTSAANAQIRTYEQAVENGTLKAPESGTVTGVYVAEGGTYAGGTAVTIQDTKHLYISTSIDEADIAKVKEGMKVLVKTDATGEEEMEAYVDRIAPTASSSASAASAAAGGQSVYGMAAGGSTGSSVSYEVKIRLYEQNPALKIDMTAKLSLIVDEKEAVLAVPYDAIYQDSEGRRYVKAVIRDEKKPENYTTKDIYVEVGLESGYYAQVTGDGITEGLEVEIPGGDTSLEDIFNGMNAAGGM